MAGKVICYHQLLGDCGAVSTYNTVMAEVLSPAPAPAPDTDCLVRINNNTEPGESEQVTQSGGLYWPLSLSSACIVSSLSILKCSLLDNHTISYIYHYYL